MKIKETAITIGQILGIALSIFLVTYTVIGWTGPTASPPAGNLPAPLSGGGDTEYKSGALGVGGLFETDTNTHLAVSGGNVGIGTTSPTEILDVNGVLRVRNHINLTGGNRIITASGGYAMFRSTNSHTYIRSAGTSHHIYLQSGSTSRMTILGNGNVGIGTTSPGARLHVLENNNQNIFTFRGTSNNETTNTAFLGSARLHGETSDRYELGIQISTGANPRNFRFSANNGTTRVMATGGFSTGSDIRYKHNIQPLTDSLSKIIQLQGVSYNILNDDGEKSLGFIAQDVREIFPELVIGNEDEEMLHLNIEGIVAPLVGAIKEQQDIIEKHEERLIDQEKRIESMENLLKENANSI